MNDQDKCSTLDYESKKPINPDFTVWAFAAAFMWALTPMSLMVQQALNLRDYVGHLPGGSWGLYDDILPSLASIFGAIGIYQNILWRRREHYPISRIIGDFVFLRMNRISTFAILLGPIMTFGLLYVDYVFR